MAAILYYLCVLEFLHDHKSHETVYPIINIHIIFLSRAHTPQCHTPRKRNGP